MKKFNLDKFYRNSKFDFVKHFWKFIIAPIALIITSIVLLCTVGFNAGFDYTGGSAITIYANNESVFVGENIKAYSLDNKDDYNEFMKKIQESLSENSLQAVSYQTTIMENEDLAIFDGDAIVVRIQSFDEEKINAFKSSLVAKLGYNNAEGAEDSIVVGTISPIISQEMLNLVIAALLIAIAVVTVYLAIRLGFASAMSVVFGLAHDILVMLCLALIFRLQVESWFLGAVIVLIMFSLLNNIFMFNNISKNATNGKFEEDGKYSRAYNGDVANLSIKETLSRNTVLVCIALVSLSLLAIIATSAVRSAVFPFLLGVCASIYASIFILPSLWAIAYAPPKKKKVKEEKKKDEYVV